MHNIKSNSTMAYGRKWLLAYGFRAPPWASSMLVTTWVVRQHERREIHAVRACFWADKGRQFEPME